MIVSLITDELGLDLAEALPLVKSWGLTHVDLRGRIFGKAFEDLDVGELAEAKALLARHGLKVACLQSSLGKAHLPGKDRLAAEAGKLESVIRAADALDCRLVRSFFFWQPPAEDRGALATDTEATARVMDAFGPLASRARQAGLVLAFENCGTTTEECLAVLDALGEAPWGLAWDVADEWFSSDVRAADQTGYINRLAPRTRSIHVKAAGIVKDLGDVLPWDRVLQACDNAGLQGPVSVETHNPARPAVDDPAMCRKVLDGIKRSWPTAAPSMAGEAGPDFAAYKRDYEPVGFVIVGLGMGHARGKWIRQTSGARVVGVVDRNLDRARQSGEEFGVPFTDDLAPWLANPECEVVYVLTPTGLHAKVALDALKAGKHVITTKPMEASIAACDEMIRAAEDNGVLLAVDFERRFHADLLGLRKVIRDGLLGRMLGGEVSLKVLRTMEYFKAGGGWRGTRAMDGGGVLSNQCIHNIDEVVFALGVPARIRAEIRRQTHEIEAEDLGAALWEYADGTLVSLWATTSYPHQTWFSRLELYGTAGAVAMVGGGPVDKPHTRWFIGGAWGDKPPLEVTPEYATAADNMAAAIRTGAPLVADGRDARRTQAVLDAMYRSAHGSRDWVDVEAELA